ncbi:MULTISPECIES: carbon starvation CstA family protein [unclassified Cellulophaga]|uniref:carbon starvation CstA family protein n=1 Tax=unclassified Cellulophaga TaxID=2634405 RepID=UPI0026E3AC3D|nr:MULTISPECIES: carbon starvation CstA family protein [unclassified Cellulophaga]MDO6492395.1 carbon starvation CstA family protein [Cellulophaga sp. 2_MG-2023]MDO6496105.1 carbon starvation CstA family protein [Cellulophaga sp. 3_MG-2023]
MISFVICVVILVLGYFIYGSYVEKQFGIDVNRKTPAITKEDGVDFVPLKLGKIFLIQFLNIAGLGPIFGAISGALWGPVAFLWITFGCIFGGVVHDYFSGMLSIRHGGQSIPEIVGKYLGNGVKHFMRIFAVVLLVLVGVVFVKGPASILQELTGISASTMVIIIFLYYILATMIPIDKLIGKVYPLFGLSLLLMAFGLFGALIFQDFTIPEISFATLQNMHSDPDIFPVFPLVFVTIACGAISGFHATQSPLMARCISNEADGKKVFAGAMVTEGIIALIWAAVAMSFFGGVSQLGETMAQDGHNAAWVVNIICNTMLGKVGGILAVFGVVAAPITSGDTAFRSARLTIADSFKINQTKLSKRLLVTIPLFVIAVVLTKVDFAIIWRYFGWSNQVMATIVLWAAAVYMKNKGKKTWFIILPAAFMSAVVTTYILVAPEGFMLNYTLSYSIGILVSIGVTVLFYAKKTIIRST